MRLAVVNITGGGLSGGYRKYLEKLIPLLQKDPRVSSLELFVPARSTSLIRLGDIPLQVWPAGNHRSGHSELKAKLRRLAPDVVFIPTARWIDCGRVPVVTMVRNMEPLVDPFNAGARGAIRALARAYMAKKACRRARRIIAVSRYVQEFLVDNWHISGQKIGVVYHGLDVPHPQAEAIKPTALEGKAEGPFIFTAGSIRPYRGLEDLVKALAIMRKRNISQTLIIGGAADQETHFYKERLEHLARELRVASHIIWAGQLNSLEMSWCFYNCDAFVMTSKIEACPNIVLEAMSHGCLCISTDCPPMPEFFGDAAFYYPPGDADGLAVRLIEALNLSEYENSERRTVAINQARQLDWDDTASATISQLQLALR